MNEITKVLKEEQKRLGMTDSELARKCKISRQAVSQFYDKQNNRILSVVRIADILGYELVLQKKKNSEMCNFNIDKLTD